MPTKTFFNLSREKQDKIITASRNEFSKHSFYDASINRIIKDAEISRGSFYLYFENKEDLFLYILEGFRLMSYEVLTKNIEEKKYDIFETLLLLYDFVTVESMHSEYKEFIITTFSNMNIKLANHLLSFLKLSDFDKNLCDLSEIIDITNLNINSSSDLMCIKNILMTILMNQIVIFFNSKSDEKQCREDLINKFNLIKHGVLKK